MAPRFKHRVEYAALRAVGVVVDILPYRIALSLGWLLSGIAWLVMRSRIVEAKRRIREVLGTETPATRVNRIAWLSLRNVVFNAIELMRMPRITREWVDKTTDYSEATRLLELAEGGKGAILVVPHTGNWDLAGVAVNLLGVPMFFVVGRQRNPLVDAWLNRMRGVTGIETIARDTNVLKRVIKNLRDGKVLAFMTDLRSRTPGMRVRFLGKEANVVGGMGLFARQAGVPVYPAVVTRVGWARHRWRVFEPIHPDESRPKEEDWQRMTQQVMDIYDRCIREEPEQYFWYNKRWVLDPLEESSGFQVPTSKSDET